MKTKKEILAYISIPVFLILDNTKVVKLKIPKKNYKITKIKSIGDNLTLSFE